jgi:DNA-binding response OmpR family regulator
MAAIFKKFPAIAAGFSHRFLKSAVVFVRPGAKGVADMTKTIYETAEAFIYDPVASNRNATRASLHSLGFRNVELAASLDVLERRLNSNVPDLILCEVAGAERQICSVIQNLRQGNMGNNPFAVVMVTTWRRDGVLVKQVLNSGADDLLARPFSTAMLAERVRTHIDRRKGFVVTTDYIGPDRRRDPSRSGSECVEVPNSLRLKTVEGLSLAEAEQRIAEAVREGRELINYEKMRRDAFQLCVQWRMLEQRHPGARDYREILQNMQGLVSEIKRRAAGTEREEAAEWCDSVTEAARCLNLAAERSRNDPHYQPDFDAPIHLLGHSTLTLGQIFANDEIRSVDLVEIDAIVARIDVRRPLAMAVNA